MTRIKLAAFPALLLVASLWAEELPERPKFPALSPVSVSVPTENKTSVPTATSAQIAAEGVAAFQAGNFAGAREAYGRVLKLEPDNLTALVNLGATEYRLGNLDKAESLLQRSLQIKQANPTAWLNLGIVYLGLNQPLRALGAVSLAAAETPDDPVARNYLGLAAGRLGWREVAEAELRRAVELKPDYADAHFNLAVFYLERTPPATELTRRHYHRARELGAAPDKLIEKALKK
jgi:Flp pilus assembly protein TadD